MVRDTSKAAYLKTSHFLGWRQHQVLQAIRKMRNATTREIAQYLRVDRCQITGRIDELREMKKIVEIGKRTCKIGSRKAYAYRLA